MRRTAADRCGGLIWKPQLCTRGEVGRAHRFESLAGWSREPADTGGQPLRLLVRVETQCFTVPQFCAATPDTAAEDDPIFKRFAAWRRSQARITTLAYDWNGSALSPAPSAGSRPSAAHR